jgi:hypothetical protein
VRVAWGNPDLKPHALHRGPGGIGVKIIETMITVLPDGSIQIPPHRDLIPGEHRAVLVVDETRVGAPTTERERVREVLRAAGKLAELTPREKAIAAKAALTLDEARAILDRSGGKPLSEIVLEMRGPKE